MNRNNQLRVYVSAAVLFLLASFVMAGEKSRESQSPLYRLLPEPAGWSQTEKPQSYFPESLFKYIDGAAENYLSYDFQELIVSQLMNSQAKMSVTAEIYDMGQDRNAFGIYSAERFADNNFVDIGLQGYSEEGVLYFFVSHYYIKLLCFDGEGQSGAVLKQFSEEIMKRVGEKGSFPALVQKLPKEGMIPNTEKYLLRNFLGYSFLRNGYLANYRAGDREFDCFFVEGKSETDAQNMLTQYLEAAGSANVTKQDVGYLVKDRYYHNIFLALVGNTICGVIKVKDGFKETGEKYLKMLHDELNSPR
jgi:hypothetical protein